jgi:uncharacterized protein (UPF0332 family)
MATWRDIGLENFGAARELYDSKQYRSSVSRFYYSVFSIVTFELARRNVPFGARNTPAHTALPDLIETYLTQFSEVRRANIRRAVLSLYRTRLDADYSLNRIDRETANRAQTRAISIMEYFGVKL